MHKDPHDSQYFLLGKLVAMITLRGCIHPDMQLANIGWRTPIEPVFVDTADLVHLPIMDNLNYHTINRYTEALFSLLDDIPSSLHSISYFRMGYVSYCGFIGDIIFKNARNNGLSSSIFTNSPMNTVSFDPSHFLSTDCSGILAEWWSLPLEKACLFNIKKSKTDSLFNSINSLSTINRFYLLQLNLSLEYLSLSGKNIPLVFLSFETFKLANLANKIGLQYTAYGLYKKSFVHASNPMVKAVSADQIITYERHNKLDKSTLHFISENVERNLFEFMWILSDLD